MVRPFLKQDTPRLVKLIPPKIGKTTLLEKIVCTRPMRQGRFNLSKERKSGKLIIHCYGMGGAGWTTLFGSVKRAVDLFKEENVSKDLPIRVVGSGCMGLTVAAELKRLGYEVSGITTKSLYDLPSWKAAGYFALVSIKTSLEDEEELREIGAFTFKTYNAISMGEHPYIPKDAVRMMPVYCSKDADSGLEDLEKNRVIPPHEEVSLDFGNGVIHTNYLKYSTYFIDTTLMMQSLREEAKRCDIPFEMRKLRSFEEVKEEIIFDCAGMGAKELNSDPEMIPVRGHLITLSSEAGSSHLEYMIYTKVKQDGKDEYIYLFPKTSSVTEMSPTGTPCNGVLGGSFIAHFDKLPSDEQKRVDAVEFKRLLDRNSLFFWGHPFDGGD